MRLLNTSTHYLQEFIGESIPHYAILSHRWEEEEVTFQDLQDLQIGEQVVKKGCFKIQGCCTQAQEDGYDWVWIDSCCIDKSSSAELSEAINSMYEWYSRAGVCYAYLSDVTSGIVPQTRTSQPSTAIGEVIFGSDGDFSCSKWFTRGWTLQELLAPKSLVFFNQHWFSLGTKSELRTVVSKVTGIEDLLNFKDASVAQKMSWASKRETTRIEDRAYSLFGLFGVNMPPIYGEGNNAFLRLQLEILKLSDDETIFAWLDHEDRSGGLLARSPSAFRDSGAIRRMEFERDRPAYLMTNKGLRMEAPLFPSPDPTSHEKHVNDTFLVPLNGILPNTTWNGKTNRLAIRLRSVEGDQLARISSGEHIALVTQSPNGDIMFGKGSASSSCTVLDFQRRMAFHVKQRDVNDLPFQGPYAFFIDTSSLTKSGFTVSHRHTSTFRSRWVDNVSGGERLFTDTLSSLGLSAALGFTKRGAETFKLLIEIHNHQVKVEVMTPRENPGREVEDPLFRVDRIVDLSQFKVGKVLKSGFCVNVILYKETESGRCGVRRYQILMSI